MEVEISVTKFDSKKPKTKLSIISKVSNQTKPKSSSTNTYHPNIIGACKLIYGKSPDQLTSEEAEHFQGYCEWEIANGQPIEKDIAYKPRD